jgi:hypothetical protein
MISEVRKKIEKYNAKHRELTEKQNYFFKKNKNFLDSNGRLKFGIDKKELEKKWKAF